MPYLYNLICANFASSEVEFFFLKKKMISHVVFISCEIICASPFISCETMRSSVHSCEIIIIMGQTIY